MTQFTNHIEMSMVLKTCWRPLEGFRCYLTTGRGIKEIEPFQNYVSDYNIVVYDGLNPDKSHFHLKSPFEWKIAPSIWFRL